jgi:hypothetical protein
MKTMAQEARRRNIDRRPQSAADSVPGNGDVDRESARVVDDGVVRWRPE